MTQNQPPKKLKEQQPDQQQSLGNVQTQGDGNVHNTIQGRDIQVVNNLSTGDALPKEKLNKTSPYKGLRYFELKDKDHFFGRDQFIEETLVKSLERTDFLLLVGASGSGKSSVVRAGLIPSLQKTWGNKFVNFVFKPDSDPFDSFYSSLLREGYSQKEAEMARAGNADTLSQVVKTLKQPETFWLIVIDQFEELFTISEDDKRNCFIDSLVKLIRAAIPYVKVVATMRAGFLGRLSPYPKLVKLWDQALRCKKMSCGWQSSSLPPIMAWHLNPDW